MYHVWLYSHKQGIKYQVLIHMAIPPKSLLFSPKHSHLSTPSISSKPVKHMQHTIQRPRSNQWSGWSTRVKNAGAIPGTISSFSSPGLCDNCFILILSYEHRFLDNIVSTGFFFPKIWSRKERSNDWTIVSLKFWRFHDPKGRPGPLDDLWLQCCPDFEDGSEYGTKTKDLDDLKQKKVLLKLSCLRTCFEECYTFASLCSQMLFCFQWCLCTYINIYIPILHLFHPACFKGQDHCSTDGQELHTFSQQVQEDVLHYTPGNKKSWKHSFNIRGTKKAPWKSLKYLHEKRKYILKYLDSNYNRKR